MNPATKRKAAYLDSGLPIEKRVEDLLSRMTIEEKVRQLDQYQGDAFISKTDPRMHTVMADDAELVMENVVHIIGDQGVGCVHDLYGLSPLTNQLQKYAVEQTRLGIPILFSEEALHGLVRPGCTIFPQAISLAATFDTDTAGKVGHAIAEETRSFGIHEIFGPVLDLAREPRWGRTEETYGEDTCLCSRMGVSMIQGLQGNDIAHSDAVIAEPKHFAVHGIPEGGLNTAPCTIGEREMKTCYLPVFEAAFREGGAVNAMCSYNSIDGVPCVADRHLLTDVLRNEWGMKGFVRSDLGAIRRQLDAHCTAFDEKDAVRQAIEAGTDMQYYDFPHAVYQDALLQLVAEGALPESTLDEAVGRVLRVKFMLGLFEHPYIDETLSSKIVRNREHIDIALEAAEKSICLLKNEGNLLPLSKKLHRIAVIGPSADTARMGDYIPAVSGFDPVTLLSGIRNLLPQTDVLFAQGTGIVNEELSPIPEKFLRDGNGRSGLFASYFNNDSFAGSPAVERVDSRIDFNWILAVPDNRVTAPAFTVRWTGVLEPDTTFEGNFGVSTQDSVRLWVNGQLLVDAWQNSGAKRTVRCAFEKGQSYKIKLEYLRDAGGKQIMLGWNTDSERMEDAAELARQCDVAILAVGDSEKTCGEGIDRSSLDLPLCQQKLVSAVCDTGTPVILVLQNGRPITLGNLADRIPAILEAWYPGEQGGTAIARVLFGDYNPAGRLPVSFPRTIGQIPVYYSRKRQGSRNYVEQDNQPQYPFGFGLSFTTFAYSNLEIENAGSGDVDLSFDVQNTGSMEGEEVVQLYLCDLVSSVARPEKELRRFARAHFMPGETIHFHFKLSEPDFMLLDRAMQWVVEPGEFKIMIGSSSDRIQLSSTIRLS